MTPARWTSEDNAVEVVDRVRHLLLQVELDCTCRTLLAGALDRFAVLERRRLGRRRLADARDCKDSIAAMLVLLSDLDRLTEGEPDRSVFREMQLLFLDVADWAESGAAALRSIDLGAGRPG